MKITFGSKEEKEKKIAEANETSTMGRSAMLLKMLSESTVSGKVQDESTEEVEAPKGNSILESEEEIEVKKKKK